MRKRQDRPEDCKDKGKEIVASAQSCACRLCTRGLEHGDSTASVARKVGYPQPCAVVVSNVVNCHSFHNCSPADWAVLALLGTNTAGRAHSEQPQCEKQHPSYVSGRTLTSQSNILLVSIQVRLDTSTPGTRIHDPSLAVKKSRPLLPASMSTSYRGDKLTTTCFQPAHVLTPAAIKPQVALRFPQKT